MATDCLPRVRFECSEKLKPHVAQTCRGVQSAARDHAGRVGRAIQHPSPLDHRMNAAGVGASRGRVWRGEGSL